MKNVINYNNMKESKKHYTKEEISNRKKASEKMISNKLRKKPPDWLDEDSKKEWKKILKDTEGFQIFISADENLLAVYCTTITQYKNFLLDSDFKSAQRTLRILIQMSDKLGLSPNGRGRLAVKLANEEVKEDNEIENVFNL